MQPLQVANEEALLALILEQIKVNAVLVYCPQSFLELVQEKQVDHICVDEMLIDTTVLRSLDKRAEGGLFRLIIATKQRPGMRGVDYRCGADSSITLIVA